MLFHGKIVAVMEPRQGVGTKTGVIWKSQDFVVETDERYPHLAKFNLYGAEAVDRANLQVGMIVDVKFEVDAHDYKGVFINELRAWDIQNGGKSLIR